MEKTNNAQLFDEQPRSNTMNIIQTIDGSISFPYDIDYKNSSLNKRIVTLNNGAIVRFAPFSNEKIAEQLVTFPIVFPVHVYWVERFNHLDDVMLFYVYKTTPHPTDPFPLMNKNSFKRFSELNRQMKQMVNQKKWLIRDPSSLWFAMAEDQQLLGFYWDLDQFISVQSLEREEFLEYRFEFVEVWNQMLDKVSYMHRLAKSLHADFNKVINVDWFGVRENNLIRKNCREPPPLSLAKFQKWAKTFFESLLNLGQLSCSFPVTFLYNNRKNVPVYYLHSIGHFLLDEQQVYQALRKQLEKKDCGSFHMNIYIYGKRSGHSLITFVDVQNKRALLFDPNGDSYDVWETMIPDPDRRRLVKSKYDNLLESVGLSHYQIPNECFNPSDRKIFCHPAYRGYCFWISYFVVLISYAYNQSPLAIIQSLTNVDGQQQNVIIETFVGWVLTMYYKYKDDILIDN